MDRFKAVVSCFLIVSAVFCTASWAKPPLGTPDFPRLGMWWPNPEKQSLSDIVRYDFVTLFDYQKEFVSSLKAQKPGLILLNSTNACELSFDDEGVDKIPAEWFLTQVGTTLVGSVNATTTSLKVNKLSVSDGGNRYALFVVGDTALIEGESVEIEAIDQATKTLTVKRGHVRPASSHAAGTRIAAHITFWPKSWLLNLSTLSSTAILDPAVGAERWGDYNARISAGIVSNAAWDGLLIDRADPDQSWLVGGSTARTIDPDQSNRLITDYSAFDNAWNEGLRNYQRNVRQRIGAQKILFTNWGIDNYDIINGNNYEGFPRLNGSSYRENWHETVFGSIPHVGSYAQWIDKGRQPNLTMVETYENDAGPAPDDDLTYTSPCANPNFVPNYQKMRFGLTTALLNDGYYSWEYSTAGHGSLCLKWFDEYDNAGQGRGYLGQPLGPAYQPPGLTLGANQLSAGTFENQSELDQWAFWVDTDSGNTATQSLHAGGTPSGSQAVRINITKTSGVDWQVALNALAPVTLSKGKDYTFSFWAKADRQRPISLWSQLSQAPWTDYLSTHESQLGTSWQHYEVTVRAIDSSSQAKFYMGFGANLGSVWVDDVRLQEGGRDVWRRDFTGGTAIVNATHAAKTIDLGGNLRKIKGSQDPAVNNGRSISQLTLPALDGIVLLPERCDTAATVLSLPSGVWKQITLPCSPPVGQRSVQAVFADDLHGVYGTDWAVYAYDAAKNSYLDMDLNGVLKQGIGYWIIHHNGSVATLDLPTGSSQTALTHTTQCASTRGCYSIPLTAHKNEVQWNMLGYPFPNSVTLDQLRVVTNSGACANGCSLDQSKSEHIVENKLWSYQNPAYQVLEGNVPLISWTGFWIAVLKGGEGLDPVLEIPAK
jgi:hypothetical protein